MIRFLNIALLSGLRFVVSEKTPCPREKTTILSRVVYAFTAGWYAVVSPVFRRRETAWLNGFSRRFSVSCSVYHELNTNDF